MFGRQDGHQYLQADDGADQANNGTVGNDITPVSQSDDLGQPPATGGFTPPAPDDTSDPSATSSSSPDESTDTPPADDTVITPETPADTASSETADTPTDVTTAPEVSDTPTFDTTDTNDTVADSAVTNDLLDIKQQALGQLSPLVGHLEQSPEERFRTTMMMIQANDNQALIKDAYEAARQIPDEKAKAQALLDVVNEINYFTQNNK